jgi:hypothetical protein
VGQIPKLFNDLSHNVCIHAALLHQSYPKR